MKADHGQYRYHDKIFNIVLVIIVFGLEGNQFIFLYSAPMRVHIARLWQREMDRNDFNSCCNLTK